MSTTRVLTSLAVAVVGTALMVLLVPSAAWGVVLIVLLLIVAALTVFERLVSHRVARALDNLAEQMREDGDSEAEIEAALTVIRSIDAVDPLRAWWGRRRVRIAARRAAR